MKRREFFKVLSGAALAMVGVRAAQARVCERQNGFLDRVYPIDSIYISMSPDNPGARLGGTWQRFGNGRCLVGVNESDSIFNMAGNTGGTQTHALTQAQMPRHTHIQNAHNHQFSPEDMRINNVSGGSGANVFRRIGNEVWHIMDNTATNQFSGGSGTAQSASDGTAHNNLQPYITVFMWRRTS